MCKALGGFTTLLDWASVQAGTPLLDCVVHHRFVVEWVVFWIQNRCKKTNMTLDAIACHEEPTRWFAAAVALYDREWEGNARNEEWTPVIDYWVNSLYMGKETRSDGAFEPLPFAKHATHSLHSLVRETMRSKKPEEENIDILEASLLSLLGIKSNDRLIGIRHARIRYAECLALTWHLRRYKRKDKKMLARYMHTLEWLQQFLLRGCNCSS